MKFNHDFCRYAIQKHRFCVQSLEGPKQASHSNTTGEVTIVDKLNELYQTGVNRRNFLMGAGALGAATVLAGCGDSGTTTATTTTPAITDNDILNFALNLEYLEAEFYLRAATGNGLAASDVTGTGTAGSVTGGTKIAGLTTLQQNILNEIAYDEQQHVKFLRSALTTAAVARPAIDLTASFNALAAAAGIGPAFNPFADWNSFLVGAFIFEDVGVTAYTGAATLISDAGVKAGILDAAAGIQAVEAYHAGYVRTAITGSAIAAAAAGTAYPYLGYANKVSALRAALGGGNETPLVLPADKTKPSAIVAADSTNAIAFARNTDQVLHIVYGSFSNTAGATSPAAGVKSGAFFPNGLNGTITVTQS